MCRTSCFKFAWKKHCAWKHAAIKNSPNLSGKRTLNNGTFLEEEILLSEAEVQEEEGKVSNSILSDTDAQWEPCSNDKVYIPTPDDVGCVLKVEVCGVAMNDDTKYMAGPVITFTDPVLAAPRAPPKRPLVTVPSPAPTTATGARFRVISYNILAEQYATKQVRRVVQIAS